jgi:hypothetical protein
MNIKLAYKQRESKPNTLEERFGVKQIISHSGFVDYEQEEIIDIKNVNSRIKELKSFSNRNYHSFKTERINKCN